MFNSFLVTSYVLVASFPGSLPEKKLGREPGNEANVLALLISSGYYFTNMSGHIYWSIYTEASVPLIRQSVTPTA